MKARRGVSRWSGSDSHDRTDFSVAVELIPVLQLLWRRRVIVGVGLLAAIAVGVLISFRVSLSPPGLHSRQHTVGVASANVLIDTPQSTVADLAPFGGDVLNARAGLLANVLGTGAVEAAIAAQADIPLNELLVVPPSSGAPLPTALGQAAQKSGSQAAPYRLQVTLNDSLPIIVLAITAPNARSAARLANGAIGALRAYLKSVATQQQIPASRQPVVTALGQPVAGVAVRGPRRLYGVAGAFVVFALMIAAIVIGSGIARAWRAAAPPKRSKTEGSAPSDDLTDDFEADENPARPAGPEPHAASDLRESFEPELVATGPVAGAEPK